MSYTGVLPDLFREGQGVVAHGRMNAQRHLRRGRSARQARREVHAAGGAASRSSSRRRHDSRARPFRTDPRAAACGAADVLRHRRTAARARSLDRRRHARGRRPVRHGRHGLRLPGAVVRQLTISRSPTSRPNSNSALPLIYRVAAVWGAHEGSLRAVDPAAQHLDGRGRLRRDAPAAALRRARARRARPHQLRIPAVHARDVESLPAHRARRCRMAAT